MLVFPSLFFCADLSIISLFPFCAYPPSLYDDLVVLVQPPRISWALSLSFLERVVILCVLIKYCYLPCAFLIVKIFHLLTLRNQNEGTVSGACSLGDKLRFFGQQGCTYRRLESAAYMARGVHEGQVVLADHEEHKDVVALISVLFLSKISKQALRLALETLRKSPHTILSCNLSR